MSAPTWHWYVFVFLVYVACFIETRGIVAIGRLCEKCDGKWYVVKNATARNQLFIYYSSFFLLSSPVCDSYVRPETLVRICDECNFGTYGGRCIICGAPGKPLHHLFFSY